MMLTIYGLPMSVKYHDLKSMIKENCNISDYILDNLVSEGDGTKKVRIGLANEREGAYFIKCLDGFRMSGNILRIVPYGKQPPTNPPQNFEQRGGYPPRNDYQNQPGPNYGNHPIEPMGQPDMMRPGVPRQDVWAQGGNQWGSNQPVPNQMGQPMPQDSYGYQQQPQVMNTYGQQKLPPQVVRQEMKAPMEQRDQYPGRMGPQSQGYSYPKDNVPVPDTGVQPWAVRNKNLRSVEIVEEPVGAPRHPTPSYEPAHKPITIMKDNFQGPQSQYMDTRAPQPYGGPGPSPQPRPGLQQALPPWAQTVQQDKVGFDKPSPNSMGKPLHPYSKDYGSAQKPGPRFSPRRDVPGDIRGRMSSPGRMPSPGRRMPSPGRRMPSPGRRMPSPGRRMPSPGRRMPSPGRRIPSPGRRMPSPGRRMPSPGRRMPSPGQRMPSPGRRMPSPGRRMPSPGRRMPSPNRRMSSPGRRLPSPTRRMPSPGRRMPSPGRKMPSPGRRMPSPGRRMPSPGQRMSPGRRHDSVPRRPASPGRYMGGRHMDKPGDKYGPPEERLKDVRPAYDPPQANQAMYSGGYRSTPHENAQYPVQGARQPEERPPVWQGRDKPSFPTGAKKDDDRRMPKFEPRIDAEPKRSPRKSRSPVRRDRSPLKDRFKKHSPSPRSPRRSWALEKRRSPEIREAPPPPIWPGQSHNEDQFRRFTVREEEKKHVPVWEARRPEDERFDNTLRVRTDLGPQPHGDPSPRGGYKADNRFPPREAREPKFEPRDEFRRDDPPKRFERDFREPQSSIDDIRPGSSQRRDEFGRGGFGRREEERKVPKVPETFNKEFEDVYKRALELNKRAEELRRRDERRREEFEGRNDRDRDIEPKHFDRKFDRNEDRNESRREPEWKPEEERRYRQNMSPTVKAKREKAVDEIANKIVDKYGGKFTGDMRSRVMEEMRLVVDTCLDKMFGNDDVSFIEMVVKFNAKYDAKAESRMFDDAMANVPSQTRSMKRAAHEPTRAAEVPAKMARLPHETDLRDVTSTSAKENYIPEWKPNPPEEPTQQQPLSAAQVPSSMMMPQMQTIMVPHMGMMVPQPVMVPPPYGHYEEPLRPPTQLLNFQKSDTFPQQQSKDDEGSHLYLCKDDFEPYSDHQADYLKKYLIQQLINVSQSGQGWSPDFTLKGLQSVFRYEVETRDEATKHWLMNLDFSSFQLFNVLVYTKEELWYERAAVWLPGHSRCRNIEPLAKLKLQNRCVEGINIGKWKFVKKVVTLKGTRIYVDMPPSAARALEKHKMLLSYELQKVSVFLKAVAVDKEAFDAGLREISATNQNEIVAAAQNSPMPSLGHDPNIVKICLKGNKAVSVQQARKIKEMIIYHIFKYQQERGSNAGRTDFVKFGYCLPGYFGLVPENPETRRWLMSLDIGKLNRHAVVILGADEETTKFIKMTVVLKSYQSNWNVAFVFERLKHSNQGVRGMNFHLWKPLKVHGSNNRQKTVLDVEMDLESIETIIKKLNYQLDFIDERQKQHTASVRYEHSDTRLEELIKKLKDEMSDSYDVANMDLASSDDDDDIVYMGEVQHN